MTMNKYKRMNVNCPETCQKDSEFDKVQMKSNLNKATIKFKIIKIVIVKFKIIKIVIEIINN